MTSGYYPLNLPVGPIPMDSPFRWPDPRDLQGANFPALVHDSRPDLSSTKPDHFGSALEEGTIYDMERIWIMILMIMMGFI